MNTLAPQPIVRLLCPLSVAFALAQCSHAATIVKTNNTDNLNLASSWTNNAVPGASDVALWDATVAAGNTTNSLGANLSWSGIRIVNPAAPVTIITTTGATNLTLGAAGIDMSAASQSLTLSNITTLLSGAAQTWTIGSGASLALGNTLTRGAQATIIFDTSAGGSINSALGAASSVLSFSTLTKTDFGALDASKNITGAASVITYTPNPAGTTANSANLAAGTDPWIDVVNSNPAIAPSAFRLSGNVNTSGIRFNVPNSNGIDWVVDANSRNFGSGSFAILVTPNAGSKNVQFNTSTGNLRLGTGSELILAQHNTSGDLVINGQITQAGAGSLVTKTGLGRAILNSAFNNYTGGTFIEQGSILVNSLGVITNSAATVNNGALLGGSGTVGAVTIASGGTLAPGSDGVGTLTIRGALTFNAGATFLNFYAPSVATTNSSALLSLSNNLVASGTVNVAIKAGTASVGQYPLLRWTNSIPGAVFSAFNLAATPAHVLAYLSNNVANSTIDLVVTNVNEPLRWATASGNWDIASTPNWLDTFGASTTYQEANSVGDSVLLEDSVSGNSPITITLNTNPVPGSVTVSNFFKTYAISGTGGIGGAGSLTKQGSGTLSLATTNTFSGGINLNGGALNFSALANLGNGVINFGGGSLAYGANADDLSGRTVTFNSGGGVIDIGANTVNYANPIGNNGAGGFTKLGPGTLTLNGTNRYSGITLVNQGTLALGANSYLSNSAAIIIAGGAVLDTVSSGVGLTLRSAVNQILGGSGTVSGNVTAPTGTTLTPATNATVGTLAIDGDLQMTGGTLVYDVSTTTRDLILANNLTLSGGFLQVAASEALTNGVYKIIQYTGALSGLAANLQLTGFSQVNKAASLSDTTPNEIDLIIGNGRGTNLFWQGDGLNNNWDELGSFNWTNSTGTLMQFISLDKVTFDDTSPNTTVNLTNVLQPGAITVNAAASYTFQDSGTGAGKISGTTGLAKSGSGTLTILTPNNNTGPTVINGGTLQVGNGSVTGDTGSGNVTNNSAVIFAQPDSRLVAGVVSGSGTLTQQGSATLALAQNNTYSGATTISSGTLQIGNGGGTGTLGTGPVVDNSVLTFNRSGTHSLTNSISGSGGLNKIGTATMTLLGNFTYQGNTYISNGLVRLAAPDLVPDGVSVPGSTGWLILDGGNTAGTFDLNGFNESINALAGLFGTALGVVTNSGGASTTNTLTVLGTAGTTFNGLITENSGGSKISLVLHGANELRLNGANNYTGGTFVGDTATIGIGPGGTIGAASSRLILSNGTSLLLHNNGGTGGFAGNAVTIPDNSQATINSTQLGNGFTGTVTGSATATNLIVGLVSFSATGVMQYQPFNGLVIVQAGAELRFSSSTTITEGGTNAAFDVEGTMHVRNNGTVTLGSLTGSGVINNPTVSGTGNWFIGAKGVDSIYSGEFSGANSLTKSGPAKLTLSGNVSYTGNTTVSNGVLVLAAGTAVLDNSPVISVKTGAALDVSARTDGSLNLGNVIAQTLSGSGTILGAVNAGANSLLSPGDSIGTLTVTNTVTIAGTNIMELNRTNTPFNSDRIVAPAIAVSGTLIVSNIGPILQGGDSFQLYSTPITGAFAVTSLPALTGNLYWTNTLALNGRIAVVNPINTSPPFITNTIVGNILDLTWPSDHTGWQLQTNSVGLNSPGQWFTFPGSTTTNHVIITINPAAPQVFFRLVYP